MPFMFFDCVVQTGRTARMGAKGMVTSLLAKRDLVLAAAIEQVRPSWWVCDGSEITHDRSPQGAAHCRLLHLQ